MRTIVTFLLFALPLFGFSQLEEITSFKSEPLSKSFEEIFVLENNETEDNCIVVMSDYEIVVSTLDKEWNLIENKKMAHSSLNQNHTLLTDDDENIYMYYDRWIGKRLAVGGVTINKQSFKPKGKNLTVIQKPNSYLARKRMGNNIYYFSYNKKAKTIEVLKYNALKLVNEYKFKISKDDFNTYLDRKTTMDEDILLNETNFYIVKKKISNSEASPSLLTGNFEKQTIKEKNYEYDVSEFDINVRNLRTILNESADKLHSYEIIDNKLIQLLTLRKNLILNVYDLESEKLLKSDNLITKDEPTEYDLFKGKTKKGKKGEMISAEKIPEEKFSKNLFLGTDKLDIIMDNKHYSAMVQVLSKEGNNYMMAFGRRKKLYKETATYSGPNTINVYPAKKVFIGYSLKFGLLKFNPETLAITPTKDFTNQILKFSDFSSEHKADFFGRTDFYDLLIKKNNKFHLVSYDRKNQTLSIHR